MNFIISDSDLKGVFPEIDLYLWKGETDYSKQKNTAIEILTNDLNMMGFNTRKLQVPLVLRSAGSITENENGTAVEDFINRTRLGYNVTAIEGNATLTLQGRYVDTGTWETIRTETITETGEGSIFFPNVYKFYRINVTVGTSINYYAYLIENTYYLLTKWKTLELIMLNNGENYTDQMIYCRDEYERVRASAKIYYDENDDREISDVEQTYVSQIRISP